MTTTMKDILESVLEDFKTWVEENPDDTDPGDIIHEIADSGTPVYNSTILEVVMEDPDLYMREPEVLAFDGTPTVINVAAGAIYEKITETLWEDWRNREEEREEDEEE